MSAISHHITQRSTIASMLHELPITLLNIKTNCLQLGAGSFVSASRRHYSIFNTLGTYRHGSTRPVLTKSYYAQVVFDSYIFATVKFSLCETASYKHIFYTSLGKQLQNCLSGSIYSCVLLVYFCLVFFQLLNRF